MRCKWCNLENDLYVNYHDTEWGKLQTDDKYLFEMLVLESFQAGLSWECILNKRDNFRKVYDNFDFVKVSKYGEEKINELMQDKGIVRNKLKIKASVVNAIVFIDIKNEYGSFYDYLKSFVGDKVIYETGKVTSDLSDEISKDLQRRGMRFVGSVIIYSYLQAIGVINSHEKECFLYKNMD